MTRPTRTEWPTTCELCEEHTTALAQLARWSLAHGRAIDLVVAALCIDVLERERTDEGLRLDPSVNGIMWANVRNEASALATLLPPDWIEDLWTVLRFSVASGSVSPDSDPERALLESRCSATAAWVPDVGVRSLGHAGEAVPRASVHVPVLPRPVRARRGRARGSHGSRAAAVPLHRLPSEGLAAAGVRPALICMHSTSVRIDSVTHEELKRLAAELRTTVGNTVTVAVRALRQDRMGAQLTEPLRDDETGWLDADLG